MWRLALICTLLPWTWRARACTQVFDINPLRAWGAVLTTVLSVSASMYLISVTPWYLLPLSWFIAGTAATGVSLLQLVVWVQG
jgi:hypothetical protein